MPTFRVALAGATLAALAVPLVPSAAHATVVAPTFIFAADVDQDGAAGLYRSPVGDPANRTAIFLDNGHVNVTKAELSPDGNRIAVLADFNTASSTDLGAQALITMNLDGSNRHTLVTETITSTSSGSSRKGVNGFAWAGNGTVVYGWFQSSFSATSSSFSMDIRKVSSIGGTPSVVSGTTSMTDPAVSPDGTQIAAVHFGASSADLVVFPATGAPASPPVLASEANTYLSQPVWSPDGANIAFVRDASDDTFDASQIDAVHFDSGTSTWSAATNVVPLVKSANQAWLDGDPAWSTDSATLMFARIDDSSTAPSASYDLWQTTNSGTWSTPVSMPDPGGTPTVDEWSPGEAPADTTAPAAVTFQPFGLAGTSIVVRWTTPDVDYSHVTLHRTDDTAGTAPVDITGVPGTSYVDKNLTLGHTYTYSADTFDGAGNQAASVSASRDVTALYAPSIVALTPSSTLTSSLPFKVTWGVLGQPAGAAYNVDYGVKSGSTWTLTAHNWLSDTTARYATFTQGVPGQTYYFRASVHDAFGNVSGTPWHGVNVPLDQKSGHVSSGWIGRTGSSYWLGSVDSTATNKASFTITPTAKSLSVIGTKCSTCGKVAIYVDGHYRTTVSTASSTLKLRQVLWTGTNTSISSHRLTLIAVLAPHQVLQIDGIGDLR